MADEPQKPTEPTFDPTAFKAEMTSAVKAAVSEAVESIKPEPPPPPPPAQPDALRKVILESVGSDLQEAKLSAASAMDYSRFYTMTPEAKKHEAKVEKKFAELVAAGRPMDRQSIFYWLRGAEFDQFHKDANEQTQQELARAEQAGGLGGGTGPGTVVTKDPYGMSPDELDKALSGRAF